MRDKSVLLTGVSGFLGKVWLSLVLSRVPDAGKVYVLVRAKRGEAGRGRMEAILNASPVFRSLHEAYGPDLGAFLRDRVEVIEGDVSEEGFGLSAETRARLDGKVDLILNCAGLVDFHADPRKSFQANVRGAVNALELARSFGCPLLHVSTAFVAGRKDGRVEEAVRGETPSGAAFDAETEYGEFERLATPEAGRERAERLGWPNVYAYSKALAEALIVRRAGGVPYSMFRPAIVESARAFPFPGWNEGVTTCAPLSYLLSRWTRFVPMNPSHTLDLVPVDVVCEAMTVVAAALVAGKAKTVYHCGTSHANPLNLRYAVELMDLAHRERLETHARTPFENSFLARLGSVTVDEASFFTAPKMKKAAALLLEAIDLGQPHVPQPFQRVLGMGKKAIQKAKWDLVKAERILEAFQPYLSRYDYRFVAENLRGHAVEEPEFRFAPERLSWANYVVRIHEPGLRKWCFPLMEGGRPETYRPEHPCRLNDPHPIQGGKNGFCGNTESPEPRVP